MLKILKDLDDDIRSEFPGVDLKTLFLAQICRRLESLSVRGLSDVVVEEDIRVPVEPQQFQKKSRKKKKNRPEFPS